ncbi:MAG: hypothetical protein GAK34_00636 [Delftia tsuruhatensis]|nr:MAG: hypothetical protein GAK34_00636 [Delftia tsuruhatensis]
MLHTPEIETAQVVRTHLSRESQAQPLARNELTMDTTVQQTIPETIGETRDTHSENSDPAQVAEHWSDRDWRENPLSIGITNRLARIDRVLQGMGVIHDLLQQNWRGETAKAEQRHSYEAMAPHMVEGLHLTLEDLRGIAVDACDSVRMNEFGICGVRR